uniref:Core domain-containing protein n=1 Tax=Hemiselmis andersenii TaxID=464988 RepID=A0A7S0TTR2_HEMAN
MVDVEGDRPALQITDRCAQRISKVNPDGLLRLRVDGGGCSGFQYKFELEKLTEEGDLLFGSKGAQVVIDEVSLEMVQGSKIDFVEEMISSSFQVVDNPQSESSCGCGASFARKM